MPALHDITGLRFGRLVVVAFYSKSWRSPFWLCQCDCGNQVVVNAASLKRGHTRSCKCLNLEAHTKHGQSTRVRGRSGAYVSWIMMLQRCTNPNSPDFKAYGGRGISVCPRWRSFDNFFADLGPRPPRWSIERLDVDGNYEPGNCKWIPMNDQWKNQRKRRPSTVETQASMQAARRPPHTAPQPPTASSAPLSTPAKRG